MNTKDEATSRRVGNCKNRIKAHRKLGNKYLAITNGIPMSSGVFECVDASLKSIKGKRSLKDGAFKEVGYIARQCPR